MLRRHEDLFIIESQQNISGLNTRECRGATMMNILENPPRPECGFIGEIRCTKRRTARGSPRALMKEANMRGLQILEKGGNSLLKCFRRGRGLDNRAMIRNGLMPPVFKKLWFYRIS